MQCLEKPGRSGRKSFVATPEQRNNVKILVGLGVPQAMICALQAMFGHHNSAAPRATSMPRWWQSRVRSSVSGPTISTRVLTVTVIRRHAESDLDAEMVAIAGAIISQRTDHFDPSTHRDRYQEALQQLIEAKTKRLTIKPRAVSTPSPVIDLMAALPRWWQSRVRSSVSGPTISTIDGADRPKPSG